MSRILRYIRKIQLPTRISKRVHCGIIFIAIIFVNRIANENNLLEEVEKTELQKIKDLETSLEFLIKSSTGKACPTCILPDRPPKSYERITNLLNIKNCLQKDFPSSNVDDVITRANNCIGKTPMKNFKPEWDSFNYITETEVPKTHMFIPVRGGALEMYLFKEVKPAKTIDMSDIVDYTRPTHSVLETPCRSLGFNNGFMQEADQKRFGRYERCHIYNIEIKDDKEFTETSKLQRVEIKEEEGVDKLVEAFHNVASGNYIQFALMVENPSLKDLLEKLSPGPEEGTRLNFCQISMKFMKPSDHKLFDLLLSLDYIPVIVQTPRNIVNFVHSNHESCAYLFAFDRLFG